MRMFNRVRVQTGSNNAGDMRHINHQVCPDAVGNFTNL